MGIQYRFPFIYKLLIPLIHRPKIIKEFRSEVGKNNTVFDLAAGYGQMARYIDPSNNYYGVDLNEKFVELGKSKGLKLEVKDIFNRSAHLKSDVYIIVDLIHHLSGQKLEGLFDLVFTYTGKKVVILEPSFQTYIEKWGVVGKVINIILKKLDYDGINEIKEFYSEEKYMKLFNDKFGSTKGSLFNVNIKKIFPYYLVTYTRSK